MDPLSLGVACITIIGAVCSIRRRAKKLLDDFKNVPRQVKQLTRDLDDWEMLLRQRFGLFTQLASVNEDVRIQMEQYLDEIESLVDKANDLIDDHEDRQYLEVEEFINLKAEFQVQETRLKLWIQLAQLQISSKSSVKIDAIEQKVNDMMKEMEGLKSVMSRPSFNQSLTDLSALAEAELRKSRLPSTSGDAKKGKNKKPRTRPKCTDSAAQFETTKPGYVNKSTQTEPSAPGPGTSNEKPLPPLSRFPPEINLDEPSSDFPLWVNGVPTAQPQPALRTTPPEASTHDASLSEEDAMSDIDWLECVQ